MHKKTKRTWKELIHPTPNAFAGASDGKNTGVSFVRNVTLLNGARSNMERAAAGSLDKRETWFCRDTRCYSGDVG